LARLETPQDLGEEALTESTRRRVETERPHDEMIIECYCFYINIIVGDPDLDHFLGCSRNH
jgi:hypothetical protein